MTKIEKPSRKSNPNRGAKPGERRGGRKKGTPNKLTADVKEMVLTALHNVGGVEYLQRQAEMEPKAFLTLIGKVIPLQVSGDKDNPFTIKIVRGLGDE